MTVLAANCRAVLLLSNVFAQQEESDFFERWHCFLAHEHGAMYVIEDVDTEPTKVHASKLATQRANKRLPVRILTVKLIISGNLFGIRMIPA